MSDEHKVNVSIYYETNHGKRESWFAPSKWQSLVRNRLSAVLLLFRFGQPWPRMEQMPALKLMIHVTSGVTPWLREITWHAFNKSAESNFNRSIWASSRIVVNSLNSLNLNANAPSLGSGWVYTEELWKGVWSHVHHMRTIGQQSPRVSWYIGNPSNGEVRECERDFS